MNVGRQREWKKRSQKRRAGVRGAASTLGKDLAGAVDDLPAQIEIPRDVVRALARAEEPPSFVKRFLAEGAGS